MFVPCEISYHSKMGALIPKCFSASFLIYFSQEPVI